MMETAQKVLQDQSVLNSVAFASAAVGGQVLHALKKWSEGEAWIMANARRTVGAIIANFVAIAGFISTGALDEITKIATVLALGLFMGFSADSAINKGNGRVVWTDEERAAKG
jgi:hypothetical protein